jgi:hypothetical protein
MDTINCFISLSELPLQTVDNAYGPLGDTQYRVTSIFNGDDSPMAFAVTSGIVFIISQDENDEVVNLFLIPGTLNDGPNVRYFVYRGLLKGDFLDANNSYNGIRPPSDDDSIFIKNLRKGQNAENALNLYDDLDDDYYIDDLFFNDNYQFGVVNQGDSIGRFNSQSSYGFEIMLDDIFFAPMLETARKDFNIIDLSESDDPISAGLQVLYYMDPAAYYGLFMHSAYSIGTNETSPTSSNKDDVYDFISQFYTKNTIYLNIRDQFGWPIDYFTDSPETIKFSVDGSSPQQATPVNYRDNDQFPIKAINTQFSNNQTIDDGQNYFKLILSLPIADDNDSPLLSLNYGYWEKVIGALQDDLIFSVCTPTNGWTDDKSFAVFAIQEDGAFIQAASYISIELGSYSDMDALSDQIPVNYNNYSDDDDDDTGDDDTGADDSTDFYFDGLFPFHMEGLPDYQPPIS